MAEVNKSEINIIDSNLVPIDGKEMEKNNMICSIIIDSSLTSNATIYGLNEKDKSNGYAMFRYHYFINKDGKIFKGRQEIYRAEIDKKFGINCIGIMLEGNFNEEQMKLIQFNSLLKLIYYIESRNPYIKNSIYTHSELDRDSKSPGNLFPYVNFKNRIYRNFSSLLETTEDIIGQKYYLFSSRDLEYKIPNMKGSDIYQLKMILIKLGYNVQNLNEVYDIDLKKILIDYCKDYHIEKETYLNGLITKDELNSLNERINNLIKDRDGKYRRYLRLTNPIMTGKDISILKNKLWILGIYKGELNNKFDEDMKEAVKSFQFSKGLYNNGEVDGIVYDAIMDSNDYTFNRVLEYDAKNIMYGYDVTLIQKALLRKGYSVNVNGYYDINTFNAVSIYQLDNGLFSNGIVNKSTFEYIIN